MSNPPTPSPAASPGTPQPRYQHRSAANALLLANELLTELAAEADRLRVQVEHDSRDPATAVDSERANSTVRQVVALRARLFQVAGMCVAAVDAYDPDAAGKVMAEFHNDPRWQPATQLS